MISLSLRPTGTWRIGPLALALVTTGFLAAAVTRAQAQGFGPDPYQPYNSQYAPFIYPVAPGPFDYGYGQAPTNGVRGANQFESYLNSLQGGGARGGARGGAGTPYFQANRSYDKQFGRIYQPNREADKDLESNQELATSLYFKMLREKNPKKRAQLSREYNRARSQVDRDLASHGGTRRTSRTSRSAARETEAETRATSPAAGDGPPPLAGSRTRPRGRPGAGIDPADAPPPVPGTRTRPRPRAADDPDAPPSIPGTISGRRRESAGSDALPSRILERATGETRTRISPRPRGPRGPGSNNPSTPAPTP